VTSGSFTDMAWSGAARIRGRWVVTKVTDLRTEPFKLGRECVRSRCLSVVQTRTVLKDCRLTGLASVNKKGSEVPGTDAVAQSSPSP
jgi:hypothetical protein